ncbi:SCP2 sterol-binding domain-containing protein [Nonomuraea sp. NPDC026600]|uniref:SCP2 sterol-binding domain-containing protein n=1 Tax=Nonomuraea sp. NPDC026600 TaxID=3155363 RepID=UPI003402F8BF
MAVLVALTAQPTLTGFDHVWWVQASAGLAEWGAGLDGPPPGYTDRAAWSVVAMRLTAPGEAVRFDALTELVVGEETLWLRGDGERVRVETGPAPVKPHLRLTCKKGTFYTLAKGQVAVDEAVASGRLVVDGDPDTARLFFELFRLPDGHRTKPIRRPLKGRTRTGASLETEKSSWNAIFW